MLIKFIKVRKQSNTQNYEKNVGGLVINGVRNRYKCQFSGKNMGSINLLKFGRIFFHYCGISIKPLNLK